MRSVDQLLKLAHYFLRLADKESYQLEQEEWESNPQAEQKGLDQGKERQKKWRESKTQEELQAYKAKYRAGEWERKKQLQSEDSLDGKIRLLRNQIAFRKKDIKKKNNPELLQKYEAIQNEVTKLLYDTVEYIHGIHKGNSSLVAKPEQLYSLITKSQSMINLVNQLGSPTITNTFAEFIKKLQETADNLTQR